MPRSAKNEKSDELDPLVHPTPWGQLLRWQLPLLMAGNGLRFATHLHAALRDQGIDLSYSQAARLTQAAPERLAVDVQFALCRVLNCDPSDLWQDAGVVSVERPVQIDARSKLKDIKPVRSRVRRPGE